MAHETTSTTWYEVSVEATWFLCRGQTKHERVFLCPPPGLSYAAGDLKMTRSRVTRFSTLALARKAISMLLATADFGRMMHPETVEITRWVEYIKRSSTLIDFKVPA